MKRVLVVDDDPNLLTDFLILCETNGIEANFAVDGMEGLKEARKSEPDLLILELLIPGLDGYNICRLLKFDSKYRHIPILIHTVVVKEQYNQVADVIAADGYLEKSEDLQRLLIVANKILEKGSAT